MEIAILLILILATIMLGVSIFFQITNSLLLIRVFEVVKKTQEEKEIEDEAKLRARGLVDLAQQSNYPLRLR